jgi:hypothetical protein
MVLVHGHTPIAIGDARQAGLRKFAVELFLRVEPPFGLAQHHQRNGGIKLVLEEALMGGRVINTSATYEKLKEGCKA